MAEQVMDPTIMERYYSAALRELVAAESPSAELGAVEACVDLLADLGAQITGACGRKLRLDSGQVALVWHLGDPSAEERVLLLGHADTVWPTGTYAKRPYVHEGERATGPGVFDMKAGLLVGLFALRRVGTDVPVTFLVTGDEEIGSAASRPLIEEEARKAQAVLVLEGAGVDGELKAARKGWSIYHLLLRGRAAHAGLEPEEGRNALTRMAELTTELAAMSDPARGLTVTPTLARAGSTINTVPDEAELSVDVRAATVADQDHIDAAIRKLAGLDEGGVWTEVDGGVNRPPMERAASISLLDRARACAAELGLPIPEGAAVGGISDANLTAALGVPTLDGLGAVGGGAHAEHEWVNVPATLERVELVAALITDLLERPEVCDGRRIHHGSGR